MPNPMVLLPALKISIIKKYTKKTMFKMAQDGLKSGKKHTHPNKWTNITGVSDVKFCAESNGTTLGFENCFNEEICPKN